MAMPSKYGNRRSESRDGHTFASKRERDRYEELAALQAAGEIFDLECQPRYPLIVGVVMVGTYVADFAYWDGDGARAHLVVEDVKGHQTQVYRLKKKLMKALYDIEILET